MADTSTANYSWTKPELGASADTWGEKWNDNIDAIDADLKATDDDVAALDTATVKKSANLSDLDNAETARDYLGVKIGEDVQAYHANLAAMSGLAGAADRIPLFTGVGAMSLAVVTESARALLDDTDAATMRATLGLKIGTMKIWVQSSDPGGSASDGDLWVW